MSDCSEDAQEFCQEVKQLDLSPSSEDEEKGGNQDDHKDLNKEGQDFEIQCRIRKAM